MKAKSDNSNVTVGNAANQYSEEVTDIIERMPVGWTKWIVSIISMIIVVFISLGFIIQYPDMVIGQITITGKRSPVRLVSATSGRIHLLVQNKSVVEEGTCVGYMETGTEYEDFQKLDEICKLTINHDTEIQLPRSLELGALSIYYNDFVLAYSQYDQLRKTKTYDNMQHALITQQKAERVVSENLQKELMLHEKVYSNMHSQYVADSLLYKSGFLSEEEYSQKHNAILSYQQSEMELLSTDLAKKADINAIDIEMAKVEIKKTEELKSAYISMVSRYNILTNQVSQWKEHNLFIAPISGTLQYLGFWRDNMFIENAREVFSISPKDNTMVGEMQIPIQGAGKVKVGQEVVVKLAEYPYDEYGYLRGEICGISSLARSIQSSDGMNYVYLADVFFPDGGKTNYGKQLCLNEETIGVGNVICEKKKLIQRLFDNLSAVETK